MEKKYARDSLYYQLDQNTTQHVIKGGFKTGLTQYMFLIDTIKVKVSLEQPGVIEMSFKSLVCYLIYLCFLMSKYLLLKLYVTPTQYHSFRGLS